MTSTKHPTTHAPSYSRLRIAMVVAGAIALTWFGLKPQSPIEASGPLADILVTEIKGAATNSGIDISNIACEMHGNLNFGVTCKVAPYNLAAAAERLSAAGWRRVAAPPLAKDSEHAPFIRERVLLSLDAQASNSHWSVSASRSK